jgi:hypothetical protein
VRFEDNARLYLADRDPALILEVADRLRQSVPERMTDTLVTKIMLGVYGCVPSWDTNFKRGFGVSTFGARALARVGDFYAQHAAEVDRWRVATLDFEVGRPTSRRYTRAKVIDMAFFIEGA